MDFDAVTISLFLASAVRLGAPLMLASIGELVSERAGIFNIAIEGIMLFAAFGAVFGLQASGAPLGGVLTGMLAGMAAAACVAVAVALLRADQIVIGIGFNILALGLTSLLRQVALNENFQPPSMRIISVYKIPFLSDLPVVGRPLFSQSPIFYAGIAIALAVWCILRFTRLGLVIRSVGEGAAAADVAGISVTAVRFGTILFTGILTGLAGSYLALVASGATFVDNLTGGRGYLAVTVVIFGRWNPLLVVLASLLFGCADALQYQGQALGIQIPPPLLLMSPFLLALIAWVLMGSSKSGPSELGIPFVRGRK